ncbi:hypothetical protein [Streptomyces sp. YIM S03343]
MHMNSVPQHLLNEDRVEFERILDEALRSAPQHPELAAAGQRLNTEQLRTAALNASALIAAAAATEYQHYVKVREELRHPAPSTPSAADGTDFLGPDGATGLATTMEGVAETTGAGAVAIAAVLTPVLAGTAAAIFLLVGYILKMLDPQQAFARTMLTTGWVFGALTAAAILVAGVGLLLTALHNRPTYNDGPYGELPADVAEARDAWRDALLERGILPFLRETLTRPGTGTPHHTTPPAPTSRMPRLGYDRPGFSSPDDGPAPGHRPSFTSPDFTSPDFGGPEHQPE